MQNVKRELSDRIGEVNKFFGLLENTIDKEALLLFPNENNRKERFDVELTATLKSSLILLLYNFVESTITNCLVVIHRTICDDNCKYIDLSESIQTLFTEYYYKALKENKVGDENLAIHLKTMINTWAYDESVKLSYEEYTKYKTGNNFAGNLDSKEINKISTKYGIVFNEHCKEIRTIRDKRNKLAHGEKSFIECCNQDTLSYIKALKNKTIDFIQKFVDSVENYLDEKKYKKSA